MAEIEKKDVDSYIEIMIKSGFSYQKIGDNLAEKSDLTQTEISDKLKSKFVPAFKKSLKRDLMIASIFGIITIACVSFYYYNKHVQDKFMQSQIISGNATLVGNGKYLVHGDFNKYEFLPTIGGWTGLFTIVSLIMAGLNWKKIITIKKMPAGNTRYNQ